MKCHTTIYPCNQYASNYLKTPVQSRSNLSLFYRLGARFWPILLIHFYPLQMLLFLPQMTFNVTESSIYATLIDWKYYPNTRCGNQDLKTFLGGRTAGPSNLINILWVLPKQIVWLLSEFGPFPGGENCQFCRKGLIIIT